MDVRAIGLKSFNSLALDILGTRTIFASFHEFGTTQHFNRSWNNPVRTLVSWKAQSFSTWPFCLSEPGALFGLMLARLAAISYSLSVIGSYAGILKHILSHSVVQSPLSNLVKKTFKYSTKCAPCKEHSCFFFSLPIMLLSPSHAFLALPVYNLFSILSLYASLAFLIY